MKRHSIEKAIFCCLFLFFQVCIVKGDIFTDSFDSTHNYLTEGVTGTGWDGFVGLGAGETVNELNASIDRAGKLYMESQGAYWESPFNPLGPFLYKIVIGDFTATVKVDEAEDEQWNLVGIMARVPSLEDAGTGEDFECVDHFISIGGNMVRGVDNGGEQEISSGTLRQYLRLRRVGDTFYHEASDDGTSWTLLDGSPRVRTDMVGLALQVDLQHANYNPNTTYVVYDDFSIQETVPDANADVLDNFEDYNDSNELNNAWAPVGSGTVTLSTDVSHKSEKSMELHFDNDSGFYYSAAKMAFDSNSDWTLDGMESMSVYFRGSAGNDADELFVVVEDNDWIPSTSMVRYDGNANDLKNEYWQRWDINLDEFVEKNPAFRLQAVSSIEIAVGDITNVQPGGTGTIYIDDITFKGIRCIDKNKAVADFDGDCDVDMDDLKYLLDRWLGTDFDADLIEDESLDFKDYTVVADKWQGEYENWPVPLDTDNFLTPVPFYDVNITGGLWAERMQVVRTVTIPHCWQQCESSSVDSVNRIDNFRKAAGLMGGSYEGYVFNDSDIYKTIEATGYSLKLFPDPALEAYTDSIIDIVEAAQWEDGYLNTYYTLTNPSNRWTNIKDNHELYCAGHLFEGAVAYYQATGKDKLLNISVDFADQILDEFGPGKNMHPPGHPEIEIGLMKMYHLLADQRYFDLAKFYCDQRGNAEGHTLYGGTYYLDHLPLVEQDTGVGHCVRAAYLYTGASDVARVNLDQGYMNALVKIWDNIVSAKTYITGGIGQPGGDNEGFAAEYHLPNDSYCETCASLAFAKWNHRMFLLTGDGKYLDMMEKSMHNNALSGISLSGDRFFYPNRLESSGATRPVWYGCACCPPHLAKYVMSIGGYAYAHNDQALYVSLYMNGTAQIQLTSNTVNLSVDTNYPWDGDVEITVTPTQAENFPIYLRIPGWARNIPMPGNLYGYINDSNESVMIEVNGSAVEYDIVKGFAKIERVWNIGDTIDIVLPMPVRKVVAHPYVTADVGLVAVQRGPIVYCAEAIDNGGSVYDLIVNDELEFSATYEPGTLNGVAVLRSTDPEITLVPYYTWANRGSTPMTVWLGGTYDFEVSEGEMQGYWKLDESSGTSASDSSGKVMNGTCMNGLSFTNDSVPGVFADAIDFDGLDDYIDLPDGFSNFSKGVTVSAWAYPTAVKNYSRFIDLGNGSASDNILFGREGTSNNLFFEIWVGGSNGGRVVAGEAIELDTWQMFTATVDASGNTMIYKDAQLAGFGKTGIPNNIARTANYIGRSNWGGDAYYQGYMDEVRVFDYAMDSNGVQALYYGGRAENPTPAQDSTGISVNTSLSWIAGAAAVKHDVYIGIDYDTVANATDTSPERVSRQSGITYVPPSPFDPATLYFWRINGLTDSNDVIAGNGVVWSFTTTE